MRQTFLAFCLATATLPVVHGQTAKPAPAAAPVMVLETVKGTIEIRLFEADAPKSVAHVMALVKRNFYRGQRFHRVTESLVQFGDPATRDMSRMASWGTGSSGNRIGVFEQPKGRRHVRGTVGLAHGGNPQYADSQIYIMKAPSPGLDGKHAIIGQVTRGIDVADKIQMADVLKLVSVR